ncbi:hypothetical protein RMATCC62417_12127 [Rhizopus microsporus]|nr:hypothetical protein RMATCC62417_12127 [Rhizopus microsporus]
MYTLQYGSLSHIFPVSKMEAGKCIATYIPGIKDTSHTFTYQGIVVKKVSTEAVGYCKLISDAVDEGADLSTISFKPRSELDEKLRSVWGPRPPPLLQIPTLRMHSLTSI